MDKVLGLHEWDLSAVAEAQQLATVVVFMPYPEITETLIQLAPKERKAWITRVMRATLDEILRHNLLANFTLLKEPGYRERCHSVRGEVTVANIQKLAALEAVESIRVESTNGHRRKLAKPRRRTSFYCVKMTIAIQVEGYERGMQTYEERYVLFRAYSEAEVLRKAEVASAEYGKPYLNSNGLLVRWKIESLDDVYEIVPEDSKGHQNLEGAEVFSILKSRRLTPR
ncbi:MAG: DUF4288 domain-containing protein, partial [Hymenobacter sp.]